MTNEQEDKCRLLKVQSNITADAITIIDNMIIAINRGYSDCFKLYCGGHNIEVRGDEAVQLLSNMGQHYAEKYACLSSQIEHITDNV